MVNNDFITITNQQIADAVFGLPIAIRGPKFSYVVTYSVATKRYTVLMGDLGTLDTDEAGLRKVRFV